MKIHILALSVIFSALAYLPTAAPRYPQEIGNAESTIMAWIGKLQGKSRQEVEKKLGTPTTRSTWASDGEQRLLLMYRFPTGGELKLYFSRDGKVLVVNHILMVQ
jgi:outer membrane protein assembly factor BamE (lipoprotein component of BamABCDE complex)